MSVQVSHVHGEAIGSGRMPLVIGESEVEERGLSAVLMFLRVWAVDPRTTWGRDSDFEEGVRRLGPAPAVLVVSTTRTSSSESRVRSMVLLSTLSFAAFSASLRASAPDAQAVLSCFLRSAA